MVQFSGIQCSAGIAPNKDWANWVGSSIPVDRRRHYSRRKLVVVDRPVAQCPGKYQSSREPGRLRLFGVCPSYSAQFKLWGRTDPQRHFHTIQFEYADRRDILYHMELLQ